MEVSVLTVNMYNIRTIRWTGFWCRESGYLRWCAMVPLYGKVGSSSTVDRNQRDGWAGIRC